jgi:hypothetical protein
LSTAFVDWLTCGALALLVMRVFDTVGPSSGLGYRENCGTRYLRVTETEVLLVTLMRLFRRYKEPKVRLKVIFTWLWLTLVLNVTLSAMKYF